MTIRSLFATRFYDAPLGDAALIEELDDACRELAQEDRAKLMPHATKYMPGNYAKSKIDLLADLFNALAGKLVRPADCNGVRFHERHSNEYVALEAKTLRMTISELTTSPRRNLYSFRPDFK